MITVAAAMFAAGPPEQQSSRDIVMTGGLGSALVGTWRKPIPSRIGAHGAGVSTPMRDAAKQRSTRILPLSHSTMH